MMYGNCLKGLRCQLRHTMRKYGNFFTVCSGCRVWLHGSLRVKQRDRSAGTQTTTPTRNTKARTQFPFVLSSHYSCQLAKSHGEVREANRIKQPEAPFSSSPPEESLSFISLTSIKSRRLSVYYYVLTLVSLPARER